MRFSILFLKIQILSLALILPSVAQDNNNSVAAKDDTYVLRPNDTIYLSVYEETDLSTSVQILQTGQASFPLIGSVEVGGISVASAAKKIHDLYAKDYLVDPKVTLTVTNYSTDFVSVIGSVRSPGQQAIPVSGYLDLGAAIATAGGVAENADTNSIQLVRSSGGMSTYSLSAVQGSAGRIRLQPGDRIIVNESRFVNQTVSILGRVNSPGPVPFPINGQLDLVTAIAKAGGLSDLANPKKVSINRRGTVTVVDFREISQRGDKPYLLQPNDVITVAERLF